MVLDISAKLQISYIGYKRKTPKVQIRRLHLHVEIKKFAMIIATNSVFTELIY